MELELCGYFDQNFGDDYMQKITAHYMPEYNFYVDARNFPSTLLLDEKNVSLKNSGQKKKLPKLLVIGSGFMVNSRAALKCELIWFLRRKHIADYCIGCNIEPLKSRLAERLVIHKLKKIKYIVCRDKNSFLWLQKRCPNTMVSYMPDILFGMPKGWLPKKSDGDKLGISLIRYDGNNGSYYLKMAQIADYWIETTGKGVILLSFDTGTEDDTSLCKKVKSLMKYKNMAEIVSHSAGGEIQMAYSVCRKIIGARFHSAVLSLKMNIDFYPIIYRQKMRNLLSDVSYPIAGCDIRSVDIRAIQNFLISKPLNFMIDKSYYKDVVKGFEVLKKQIEKEKR